MSGLRVENGQVVEDLPPLKAEFFEHAKKVGIGKWEPRIYIKFRPSSDSTRGMFSREATDKDKAEYSDAWERFEAGQVSDDQGMPLTCLRGHKTAFEMELRTMGIETVEQLAIQDEPYADYVKPMWDHARLLVQVSEQKDEEVQA